MRSRRPNPLPLGRRLMSNLVQAPFFGLSTVVCGSVSLLVSLVDKSGRVQHRIAQMWARISVWASGARLTVVGAENLRMEGPVVFAANHTSYMDTPVVFSSLPNQFRILAKIELWRVPFIGWYLSRSGQIPIDTANPRATVSSLSVGVKALKAGMPIFVFPEGGRTPDGEVQTFMNGATFLAIRAQVPLVPLALIGVYDLLPIHTHHFYPTPMKLVVGEAISTQGRTMRDVDALTAELKDVIERLIRENGGERNAAMDAGAREMVAQG